MRYFQFCLLILALFLCLSYGEKAQALDESVKNAYFAGRSPDIVVHPVSPNEDDTLLVRLENKEEIGRLTIKDVDIAYSVLAPSHGIEISEEHEVELPGQDLFSKTKLNLVFVVESIGKQILSKFDGLTSIVGAQCTVKQTSFGQDGVSLATSIISGREPRSHGIVGSRWHTSSEHTVDAYKSPRTMSLVPNYPDVLSKLFVGNSLILGASADFQLASSISAHPALFADHPFWNDFGFYWDETLQSFESLYPFAFYESDLMLSKSKIAKKWEKKIGDVMLRFDSARLLIEIPSRNVYATFRVNSQEDFEFAAELRFVLNLLEVLSEKESWAKLIADDYPDFIALGFSSLSKIASTYGVDSKKFEAALFAVDSLITYTTHHFKQLYSQSAQAHSLFLSATKVQLSDSVKSIASSVVSQSVEGESFVSLPQIVVDDKSQIEKVCENLRQALSEESVQVFCPSLELRSSSSSDAEAAYEEQNSLDKRFQPYEYVLEISGNSTNSTVITYGDVLVFQLMLWFTVAIIAAVICGSCAVFMVDIPTNSNLIRQLPNLYHNTLTQKNLW